MPWRRWSGNWRAGPELARGEAVYGMPMYEAAGSIMTGEGLHQGIARTSLSPATRFVLDLVTAHLTRSAPPSAAELDWPQIVALTEHHRLVPFLVALKETPPSVLAQLRELRNRAACASLLLSSRLKLIAERFHTAGIEMLVLKGIPQSAILFGDIHARSCRDIDLLIRPAQAGIAINLLRDLGYGGGTDHVHEASNAVALLHRDGGPPVEVHTSLSEADMAFAASDFDPFTHSVKIMVAGQEVRTLSPAATIAYAAWHAGRHRWTRIYWLADLAAAAIHRSTEEWQEAAVIARRAGCERHLSLAAWLVKGLMGITPPLTVPLSGRDMSALRRAEAVTLAIWAQAPCGDQAAARNMKALDLARADIGLYKGRQILRVLYSFRYAALNRLMRLCRRKPE